ALLEGGRTLAFSQPAVSGRRELPRTIEASLQMGTLAGAATEVYRYSVSGLAGRMEIPGSPGEFRLFVQPLFGATMIGASPNGTGIVVVERPNPSSDSGQFVVRRFGIAGSVQSV